MGNLCTQTTATVDSKCEIPVLKIIKVLPYLLQSTTTLFKVPHHPLQITISFCLKYHTAIFKVLHNPLQCITSPSLKYHNPLQIPTPPFSKYHTTLFKLPHHPFQSTTSPYTWNNRLKPITSQGQPLIKKLGNENSPPTPALNREKRWYTVLVHAPPQV